MRVPVLLSALFTLLSTLPARADLSDIAQALAAHPAIPGGAVGMVSPVGQDSAVAGLRRIDGGAPVEPDDLWHLGSLTKSMTATLAARMVEAGDIEWHTTIGAALGDLVPGMRDAWRDVTLEELLRHASGMRANLGIIAASRLGGGPRSAYVEQVLGLAPRHARGGFHYSNAGYVVAGAMLEAAGGAPWEYLIATRVFRPLHMDSAGFGPPLGDQPLGHRAPLIGGLRAVPPGPRADNIAALGPAGRVHLSTADMLRYLAAHAQRDPMFLSAESWDKLHRAAGPGDYALGWAEVGGILRHSGSNTMWFANARFDPARGCASFVAVNSAAMGLVDGVVTQAGDAVFRLACGD
ncbi:beta-lactamase family protein [Roseibacterium beibuensis]|uniref:Serine hydrolase domain-containing protein n=1 Tax=[Roseibacterium] beibuensis TaxID=1193142 RepID=A0ABP9KT55_9RHOB|nr:serine hydrolase domain-containing protein [Roseibacterium beibuensis]MCS6622263.1 beta-lactamase family protein [Roseibacterium beibuensis]